MAINNFVRLDDTFRPQSVWMVTVKRRKYWLGLIPHKAEEQLQFRSKEEALRAVPELYIEHRGNIKEILVGQVSFTDRYIYPLRTQASKHPWIGRRR